MSNRIGNTERLIMALRDPQGNYAGHEHVEFLRKLKTFEPFFEAITRKNSHDKIMNAVADMIEEAMELE